MKFYYKERTAKNQCKVLSEEKGMLTIQMRDGGKFLVSKNSVLKEAKSNRPVDLQALAERLKGTKVDVSYQRDQLVFRFTEENLIFALADNYNWGVMGDI